MISITYRRSALKLIARVRMVSKRSLPHLSSVGALAILAVLVGGGWLILALGRTSSGRAAAMRTVEVAAPKADVQATPVSNPAGLKPTVLARREPMVYVIADDSVFYHCSVHVMHETERQAVGLSVAKSRGLEPCPVCFKAPVR